MKTSAIQWPDGNCGHQHREVLAAARCLRWHREHQHPEAAPIGPDAEIIERVSRDIPSPDRPRSASRSKSARTTRARTRHFRKGVQPRTVALPEWDSEEIDGLHR